MIACWGAVMICSATATAVRQLCAAHRRGRRAGRRARRRHLTGRIIVTAAAATGAVLLFIPAIFTRDLVAALPYLIGAACCLSAQNPPLDAARLDIMPPPLWGRAESIRTPHPFAAFPAAGAGMIPLSTARFRGLIGAIAKYWKTIPRATAAR
jgi:hypothetical protein